MKCTAATDSRCITPEQQVLYADHDDDVVLQEDYMHAAGSSFCLSGKRQEERGS